ncbi:MAG: aspartate--ammonia ligase [Planctomycetota bacterium]|jgi:aspartate--ammonia ligase
MTSKAADLAGPGIGNYDELREILPATYQSFLSLKETQRANFCVKTFIEEQLCEALNLIRVEVPLIVDVDSGVNDMLDRDGSRTPIEFHISNDRDLHPIDAQIVQAATKWKRMALKQFGMSIGEGLITDMRAVRKDYFLDHDHSAYVDQWDWELAITPQQRTLEFLTRIVEKIWSVLKRAETHVHQLFPQLKTDQYPNLPEKLTFIHAEDLLARYPDLPRKQRETEILKEHPAIFIYGIGWPLADGYPHEMRAADYDDWITETTSSDGRPMHGLNGDILVWNPVTKRRHELTSMGIRVNADTLQKQLEMSGQLDSLELPYHQAILSEEVPLSTRAEHPRAGVAIRSAHHAPRRRRHARPPSGRGRGSSLRTCPDRDAGSPPPHPRARNGGLAGREDEEKEGRPVDGAQGGPGCHARSAAAGSRPGGARPE